MGNMCPLALLAYTDNGALWGSGSMGAYTMACIERLLSACYLWSDGVFWDLLSVKGKAYIYLDTRI
jgi:hypothetical protein